MDTQEFNEMRAESYTKKMTADKSRLWLMIGMKEDGSHTFVADDSLTPLSVAEKLERIAKIIRQQHG
jgi:hypothetical protein